MMLVLKLSDLISGNFKEINAGVKSLPHYILLKTQSNKREHKEVELIDEGDIATTEEYIHLHQHSLDIQLEQQLERWQKT